LLARSLTLLLLTCSIQSTHAVGIGKVTLLSSLGEPLHAQVDLQLGRGEIIEDSCLSLSAADEIAGNGLDRLSLSDLSAKLDPTKRKVEIVSRKAFIEPFAIFRLRIKCPDTGSVSKTLTLLPEPAPAPAHLTAEPVIIRTSALPQTIVIEAPLADAPPRPISMPAAIPQQEQSSSAVPARRKKTASHRTNNVPQAGKSEFRLKVSGEPLDLSRIGKLSAEDRAIVLAQQKLLDEDDQTARFLAMQNQVRLMQEELLTIRAKLAEMEKIASAVPPASPAAISVVAPQNWTYLILLAGVCAALLLTWLLIRHSARSKSRAWKTDFHETQEKVILPDTPAPHTDIASYSPFETKVPATLTGINEMEKEIATLTNEEEVSVLEEAELYAIYGHADKAVKMLNEYIAQHPASENVWLLMFSIYSSGGQADDFEKAARIFQRNNQNSELWKTIQALGRTLDKDHSLYTDDDAPQEVAPWLPYLSKHKHRPLGDILVELGHISPEDMRNCLQDFNPKHHGRFGNYLLSKRLVSHAQLNEALLIQQGGSDTGLPSEGLPSLQQVENLLSGFDPEKDGSVEDYLMAHQADVAERLEQAQAELHRETEAPPLITTTAANELPDEIPAQVAAEPDKFAPMEFVLDLSSLEKTTPSDSAAKSQPITIDFDSDTTSGGQNK